jgi:hypothetical protein
MKNYLEVEDLEVYQKLCQLHIEILDWTPYFAIRVEV